MRYWLLLLFCFTAPTLFAQDKQVAGLVFDKDSKERIAKVNIRNLRNGQSVYNTLKADFKISARPGDALVISKQNYFNDTVRVPATGDMAVYLKAKSIMLKEVNVRDTILTADQKLQETRKAYSKIYGSLAHKDILSIGPNGAGIGIDAIWNMLSRSGRNATHLRELIEQDYKLNVIDQRFSKKLVQQVTGLQDPQLSSFMARYRPSYYMVTTASDYEFINQIKSNLKRFQRNPNAPGYVPLTP